MTSLAALLNGPTPPDEDLVDQARPGHGVPSQDPDPAAQRVLEPEDAAREAQSVWVGGGVVAGAATGAAVGVMVAGPVGVAVGTALGAVAGAVGGAMAGATDELGDPEGLNTKTRGRVNLYIEDTGGSGRPLVLIHGWPLSAQAWAPQVPALQAAGFRVVAYDRRGFGRSEKPRSAYGYDVLADDLQHVMNQCALQDVTLVGFSMGGGEVARYIGRWGQSRVHSAVFAAAVTPCLMRSADNPDGPLTHERALQKKSALEQDRDGYFEQFVTDFFSANEVLQVTLAQRADAVALCHQSAQHAALACMDAFGSTDFRADLKKVTVPTLVIHGTADGIVPIEGSGMRTHRAVPHSQLVTVGDAPHGFNLSHAQAFNDALLAFLRT